MKSSFRILAQPQNSTDIHPNHLFPPPEIRPLKELAALAAAISAAQKSPQGVSRKVDRVILEFQDCVPNIPSFLNRRREGWQEGVSRKVDRVILEFQD